jgi:7,8-dihydroneopterin aldolase/epimerase/oxygenase
MDETAIAFELPHARASATHVGPPLDRISVRDYTRAVEIGAFRTERGVTQRIRFNVVLEVGPHTAAQDDDVDKVISYDTITEAIEAELAAERVNLLETLAERVAARCLADPRAVRVFVRIEKLDRIPGALGVEIARTRLPDATPRLRPADPAPAPGPAVRPLVVFLPAAEAAGPRAGVWRDALAALARPLVVCVAPAAPAPDAAGEAARRIGLLAVDQAAWAFTAGDDRFGVAASRTELDWALKTGRLSVWAPAHMAAAARARPAPDATDPLRLAAWLAEELDASTLAAATAGSRDLPGARVPVRAVTGPEDLATLV